MCGILGINERNEDLIKRAAALFPYRGPDWFGMSSDDHATLGHHRLAIIDLDPRANQPMSDESGDTSVIFSGEIYNFLEIKKELIKKRYVFRTESDTEVLLNAYKEWGVDLVEHIDGMFAAAFYDRAGSLLVLLTDRENMKPIFYTFERGVFAFASELKGVAKMLKEKNIPLTLDQSALKLYFVFGYVPVPRTLYREIHRLAKRTCITFDLKARTLEERVYAPEKPIALGEEALRALIEKKIEAHLIADVPVGVLFSGGTDSSLIVAVLHKLGVNLKTFSLRIEGRAEDRKYFEAIAKHLNISPHIWDFGVQEFDSVYEEVMREMDDPIADNSLVPTHFIAKKAREEVTVVLSGEGGDEFFYGYSRSFILNRMNRHVDAKLGISEHLFFALPSFKAKNKLFEKLFIVLRRPIAFYLLTMTPARDFLTLGAWLAAKQEIVGRHIPPSSFDPELYLENDLLRKTDIATARVSLEGRVPLLDKDIVAAARGSVELPHSGILKPYLKKVLSHYLPPELVYRGKMGFGLKLATFFHQSPHIARDLPAAVTYLKKHGLLDARTPSTELLMKKHMQYAWQLIVLYHALKNTEEL